MTVPDRAAFYRDHYEVVATHCFETGERVTLSDGRGTRKCRFCERGESSTEFRSVAHAIPEFLGNRTVFSSVECDACNAKFGREYEDHLAKCSHLVRSLSKIRGKKKLPTYKSASFRIEPQRDNLHIRYTKPIEPAPDIRSVPFDLELPADPNAQPYVPLKAAMALTKIAVSICPSQLLDECEQAIRWLNYAQSASVAGWRVMFAFTPGPVPKAASHATLIRRKTDSSIPFMWLIL